MAKIIKNNLSYTSIPSSASMLPYDNSDSGLDATNVQGAIDELSQGGGGATELEDLSDVTISSATTGQVLKYNNGTWENANESTGSTVSVTQIQSTGTKIATISVDSVDTDLYAPTGGSGGHTILDNEGDTLTQQPKMQFIGAYSENDSVNTKTVVNVVRSMTTVQFNQLSSEEKVGFINITDDTGVELSELSDVDIDTSTLVDGQALIYDSNSGEWVNGAVLTTVDADDVSFDDTDVDFTASNVQEAFENIRVTLTQLEYDALSTAEKNNGTIYYISDANGDGSQFQPIIYSTTEREIGVWIDGKPLYEISLHSDLTSVTYVDIDVTDLHLDTLVSYNISHTGNTYYYSSSDYIRAYITDSSSTTLKVIRGSTYPAIDSYTTIRYTKTTDTAGSGTWTPQGVPAHHYSTDEQIVGSWIDGKPVYEKTLNFTPNDRSYEVNLSSLNIDNFISVSGFVKQTSGNVVPLLYGTGGSDYAFPYYYTTGQVLKVAYGGDYNSAPWYVTIRYTKLSA